MESPKAQPLEQYVQHSGAALLLYPAAKLCQVCPLMFIVSE